MRARMPDLLLLHLPKVLLEPFLHPLAVVGKDAGRCNGGFQVSKCILRHYPLKFVLECSSTAPRGKGGEEGPAVVPGDELVNVQAGGKDGSLSSC
jgi:hypothetical protein